MPVQQLFLYTQNGKNRIFFRIRCARVLVVPVRDALHTSQIKGRWASARFESCCALRRQGTPWLVGGCLSRGEVSSKDPEDAAAEAERLLLEAEPRSNSAHNLNRQRPISRGTRQSDWARILLASKQILLREFLLGNLHGKKLKKFLEFLLSNAAEIFCRVPK